MATRYEHTGNAVPTTITLSIDADDTSITIADATGWPTGGVGPFWVTIGRGTASEEKVLIASRSGTTLTVSDRGADGTTAASHATPAVIEHTWSSEEADDANELAAQITTLGGTPLTTTAAQTVTGKTFDVGDNTVTGTKAEFNAALTDADFATLAGTETLTGKTLTAPALTAPTATGSLVGFGEEWTDYTPTWDATSDPAIGNGGLVGRYMQIGKTVFFRVSIGMGASTTYGSGTWVIGLPVEAAAAYGGAGHAAMGFCAGVRYGGATVESSTTAFSVVLNNTVVTDAAPGAWAAGNLLVVHGVYEAA